MNPLCEICLLLSTLTPQTVTLQFGWLNTIIHEATFDRDRHRLCSPKNFENALPYSDLWAQLNSVDDSMSEYRQQLVVVQ